MEEPLGKLPAGRLKKRWEDKIKKAVGIRQLHSLPSSSEVKNAWYVFLHSHIRLHDAVLKHR